MKILLLIPLLFAISACDYPTHIVIENGSMIIYKAEEMPDKKYGNYRYAVRDNSTKGWTFYTDMEYSVGDRLEIVKVEE